MFLIKTKSKTVKLLKKYPIIVGRMEKHCNSFMNRKTLKIWNILQVNGNNFNSMLKN